MVLKLLQRADGRCKSVKFNRNFITSELTAENFSKLVRELPLQSNTLLDVGEGNGYT